MEAFCSFLLSRCRRTSISTKFTEEVAGQEKTRGLPRSHAPICIRIYIYVCTRAYVRVYSDVVQIYGFVCMGRHLRTCITTALHVVFRSVGPPQLSVSLSLSRSPPFLPVPHSALRLLVEESVCGELHPLRVASCSCSPRGASLPQLLPLSLHAAVCLRACRCVG